MIPVRLLAPAVVVGALLLTGCTQDGNTAAGVPVPTTSSTVDTGGGGAPGPASAAAIAKADLKPCPTSSPGATPVAGGLPDVTLACLGTGPQVRLSALRGTPTVVNVWGSWCTPCRQELPVMAAVSKAATGKVDFLGLDVQDGQPDQALGLLAEVGARYPSVVDYSGATKVDLRWGAGVPRTAFVRADGTIAGWSFGAVTSADELRSLIQQYLDVSVPA